MHFLSIPKALALAVAFVLSGIALASHSQEKIVRPKDGQSAVSKDGLAKLLEASRAIAAKDPKSAELAFREAAKLLPNSIEPLLGLAEVARMRNDSKSIEKWLKEALKVAPGNAEAQVAWGRYLFATKKFAEAETALKKARALDAALLAPSLDLGELYLSGMFKPRDAEEAFRTAIKIKPDHAGAHNGLASALAFQKRPDEAAVEYEAAAKLAPKNPLPLHLLGRMYQYGGQPEKALLAYERVLKINPEFTAVLLDRGELFASKNQLDKALADYSAAVKSAPKQALPQFRLGMLLQKQNRGKEAAAAYRAAIALDPKFALAYNNLAALSVAEKSSLADALTWAKKAVEIEPEVPNFADTLGQVHRARGELDLAIEQFRRATNATPPRAEFFYRLGVALADKGNGREAVTALKRSLEIQKDFFGAGDAQILLKKLGG